MSVLSKLIPPQYRILAVVLLLGAVAAGSGWAGWEWRDRSCDVAEADMKRDLAEAVTKATNQARKIERMYDEVGSRNATIFELREQLRQEQGKVVTKEVIKYVSENPGGAVQLPDGWVHAVNSSTRYDAGAADATGEPDGGDAADARADH